MLQYYVLHYEFTIGSRIKAIQHYQTTSSNSRPDFVSGIAVMEIEYALSKMFNSHTMLFVMS